MLRQIAGTVGVAFGLIMAWAVVPACAAGWVAAPSLNLPRERFGAAVDEDGSIWVLGGGNRTSGCGTSDGPIFDSVERLVWDGDSYGTQWEQTSIVMPSPRINHSVAIAHGYLYVIGGFDTFAAADDSFPLSRVDRYDLLSGDWRTDAVPPLPTPMFEGAAIADRFGRIWVIGGMTQVGYQYVTTSVLIFDPSRPSLGWQQGPALNQARADFGCVVDTRGRINVIGGYGTLPGPSLIRTIEQINPHPNSQWTVLAQELPQSSSHSHDHAALGGDGQIYDVGGVVSGGDPISDTLRMDPRTGASTSWHPLNQAKLYHRLVLGRDQSIYAIGGSLGVSGNCASTAGVEKLFTGRPPGDVNADNEFNGDDIQPIVNALLAP